MAKSAGLGDLLSNIPIVDGLADYGRGTGGLLTKRDNKKMEKSGRIMKTSKFGGKKHYIKKVGREASSPQKAVAASFASSGGHLDSSNNGRLPLVGSLIKISNGDASFGPMDSSSSANKMVKPAGLLGDLLGCLTAE